LHPVPTKACEIYSNFWISYKRIAWFKVLDILNIFV